MEIKERKTHRYNYGILEKSREVQRGHVTLVIFYEDENGARLRAEIAI